MRYAVSCLVVCMFFIATLCSCSGPSGGDADTSPMNQDTTQPEANSAPGHSSARDSLRFLYDSLQSVWGHMKASHRYKQQMLERYLQEVNTLQQLGKLSDYSAPKLQTLKNTSQNFPKFGLKMHRLEDSAIDRYDQQIEELDQQLYDFTGSIDSYQNYGLLPKLSEDLHTSNDSLVWHRVQYVKYVHDYNRLLRQNRDSLKAWGAPFGDMKPAGTFSRQNAPQP